MPAPRRTRLRPAVRLHCEPLETRLLPSASPIWRIAGDTRPDNLNDTIVIDRDPANSRVLRAVVNGEVVDTHRVGNLWGITINAGQGDDVASIDPGVGRMPGVICRFFMGAGDDHAVGGRAADRIFGGDGDDDLVGGGGNDSIFGQGGDDTLDGATGRDRLEGGGGDDSIHGGAGRDVILGGAGHNTVFGKDGEDRVVSQEDDRVLAQANANPLEHLESLDRLHDWVVEQALQQYSSWFGQKVQPYWWWGGGVITLNGPVMVPSSATSDRTSTTAATDHSTTNTQEAGVDEADILETDGQYLYTVVNGKLLVIDARTPSEMAIVGQVDVGGSCEAFYLMGDRIVLLSQTYKTDETPVDPVPLEGGVRFAMGAAIWWPRYTYTPQTQITTVDIGDPADPTIAQVTTLDGSLVDSRAVNGRVYVVVDNSLSPPRPEVVTAEDGGQFYESQDAYLARLDQNFLESLPGYTTTGQGTGSLVVGADVYVPMMKAGGQLLSVTAFDPEADAPGPLAVTTTVGASGTVYASADSLYVASVNWGSWWGGDDGPSTDIYKFALGSDSMPLDAVGSVAGTVLNQFSMDEEAGYFRIATTDGWGNQSANSVFVLADTGDTLDEVGAIRDLGLGENIRSVRFEGDHGYVVTFRQVDPLFTLDLSNPTDPRVAGELKVPGYSSYLQQIDATHVIGLGRDADENGRVRGLQVSLFDVSDPANPERVAAYSFSSDAWGGYSQAEWDHHALSYFAEQGILALPVSTYNWDGSNSRLEVLHVTAGGIESLGAVVHESPILRSLRIGGLLFSMSSGEIQAHNLTDPSQLVGTVTLPAPEPVVYPPIFLRGGIDTVQIVAAQALGVE